MQQNRGPRYFSRSHHHDRSQPYDNNSQYNNQRNQRGGRMPRRNNNYDNYDQHQNQNSNQNQNQNQHQDHGSFPRSHSPRDNNIASVRKIEELSRSISSQKSDIDELRVLWAQMSIDLEDITARLVQLESSRRSQPDGKQLLAKKDSGDWNEISEREGRKNLKKLKYREKKAAKLAEKRAAQSEQLPNKILNQEQSGALDKPSEDCADVNEQPGQSAQVGQSNRPMNNRRNNRDRNGDMRRPRREPRDRAPKPLPKVKFEANLINDDSTTQAHEPSSEDRAEGDEGREGNGKERVRVLRRKKPNVGRQGGYGNRRRRADSSERNSNDTSPQETNGTKSYQDRRKKNQRNTRKAYPELSETEMSELLQSLKHQFTQPENGMTPIISSISEKGPRVAYEFVVSILDHAICDVTNSSKLSEIASNLRLLLLASGDNSEKLDFQVALFDALSDISKREEDIAIDAPRYMDTLGQILAEIAILMTKDEKSVQRKFLRGCATAYKEKNRALLVATILKLVAEMKGERLAKEIYDCAEFVWSKLLDSGEDESVFLANNGVEFTTKEFPPETQKPKKSSKEYEKFADDVTALVEKGCNSQVIEDLVKDLKYESEYHMEYQGTLVYAIVRGCLVSESGDYRLDNDVLTKYLSILNAKHDNQDAILMYALTALTKLWHQYNCPQDIFRTILMALHNHGIVSYDTLNDWLISDTLNNVPGIGAARLSSKRYIQDLGANLKTIGTVNGSS